MTEDEIPPSHPEFWSSRYLSANTPWDSDGVPVNLQDFLRRKPGAAGSAPRPKVLIPGCGLGHEVKAFTQAGYDVTAIDFAPGAVERARRLSGTALASRIILGNFFTHEFPAASFDYIYERAFLCSLLPDRREAYRARMASLLKYQGSLLGYFYYQPPVISAGPPYGFAWGKADELFERYFLLVKDDPATGSVPMFAGRERWQEWRRTSFKG
jgi:hypothetical protein